MEPFKIRCVTCQAGLSVRNESLLGQIVACPRCGSMVEVRPPSLSPKLSPELAAEADAGRFASETVGPPVASASSFKLIASALACVLGGAAVLGFVLLGDEEPTAIATSIVEQKSEEPIPRQPPLLVESALLQEEKTIDVPQVEPPTDIPAAVAEAPAPPVELSPARPTDVAEPKPPSRERKFNPLEFDPENLDLMTLDQGAVPPPAEPSPKMAVIDPAKIEPQEFQPTMNVVRRSPDTTTSVQRLDGPERLRQRIPALQFESMPLGDFLRLLSHLSGVAISIAPDQLLMSGITVRQKVSLDATDISLDEALVRVLAPLKLEHVASDEQVVVLRREASKIREVNYPIADLIDSSTSAELLAQWTQRLVAPETWQAVGGSGVLESKPDVLRVTQSQQVHYQLLIFLDRLRLARNLPPVSRFPVQQLAGASPWSILSDRLGAPATFTFSQYTTLDEIIAHWQQELGVPILIDWPALANEQLWPQTRIACAIAGEPWSQALDRVLAPLGLSWRAVPGNMVEITSTEKVDFQLQLDLFPLRGDAGKIMQELRVLAEPLAAAAMVHDAKGNVLIALQPAAAQRKTLQQLRKHKFLLVE